MPGEHTAISYSWDDEAHKAWVKSLATRLRTDGVDVVLDQWNLSLGERLPAFMESLVRDSRFVMVVGTPGYKDRFDGRKGGTGYEGHIITADVLGGRHDGKFIPVLRSGDWTTSLPTALAGVLGVDLRGDPYLEEQYQQLLKKLHGVVPEVPSLGTPPAWLKLPRQEASSINEPAVSVSHPSVDYLREIVMLSVTDIERTPAQFWKAAQSAVLGDVAWPLSIYWYGHTGGDRFVRREITPDGFRTDYQQQDALVVRAELLDAVNPGKVVIRETQEFPSRYRNGGFPYDIAIVTTAEAVRFAVRFFTELGVGGGNTIAISMTWNGIKGRFITADAFPILPSYEQKRSATNNVCSPEVRFQIAHGERLLVDHVRKLLGPLFSQFDMFDPAPDVFTKVLEHWQTITR